MGKRLHYDAIGEVVMMTEEEISDIRYQIKILERRKTPEGDCPLLYPGCECGRSKLLAHIDDLTRQISILKKICISERFPDINRVEA